MASLISLIVIITVSMLITKIASVSLTHTGLSRQSSRFQARSALTGVGFTTKEAEKVINHPVRRRIIMALMLVGNAGVITAIASLMLTFINVEEGEINEWIRLGILFVAMLLLLLIARSKAVDRGLSKIINRLLGKYTDLNVRGYARLLRLTGEYSIYELKVEEDDWLVNQTFAELNLRHEGINVLSIIRSDNTYLCVPTGNTEVETGDTLLLYGKSKKLKRLDQRRKGSSGDSEHEKAIEEYESDKKEEKEKDKRTRDKRKKE